jgi:hypothetical protein
MSEQPKHTPGPWYVDRAHARPTRDDLLAIYAANGDRLAILTDDPSEEWRANAQLMASAPELLAEAEAALALISQAGDQLARRTYFRSPVVVARLKAVIAKAKGESG